MLNLEELDHREQWFEWQHHKNQGAINSQENSKNSGGSSGSSCTRREELGSDFSHGMHGGGLGGSFAERSKVWLVDVVAKDGQDL